MSNVEFRNTCVLYLTATCNLKCRYCYIDKSPVLQEIDKILEDTYKTDYFFNFMKKVFPNPKQLKEIEFWGGEPSYGLPRVGKTVENAIDYYPNLKDFMMSTNLTTDRWWDDFSEFIRLLKKYPERMFDFRLQLSLDGPTEVNDINRGNGVTLLFTKNFAKLIQNIDALLEEVPNVKIYAHFKPTLDNSSIAQLQTKEALINYFKFFENYKDLSNSIVKNSRWFLSLPLPNTAVPSPHSSEDGKRFANLCKLALEISKEYQQHFSYFNNIVPFSHTRRTIKTMHCLDRGCGTCGTGKLVVGLLPNNLVSTCHNGFVDLISDYKLQATENVKTADRSIDFHFFLEGNVDKKIAFTLEEYEAKYENIVNCYHTEAKFQTVEVASQIQMYAMLNQIDKKYEDPKMAVEAAHFIFQTTSSCLRDNVNTTGSHYLVHPGLIKLMLNGAKEYIENAAEYFSK